MKFPLVLPFILLLSTMTSAQSTNVYFTEVIAIDHHNIMTVLKNGKKRLIKLAYLRTPLQGEFKHEIVYQYLKQNLLNKWVRVSELSGTGRAKVYRSIIRDSNQKIINVVVAAKGYGVPVKIENPPQSIFDASKIAEKNNQGIWENSEHFASDQDKTKSRSFLKYLDKVKKTLKQQKDPNNQIFIGNKKDKTFTPLKCFSNFDKKNMVVFATKHVGINRNYVFIPCKKEKSSPSV